MTEGEAIAVLDASALLALLQDEPGAEAVGEALIGGAVISSVNWAEVLSKIVDFGRPIAEAERLIATTGVVGGNLAIVPFDRELARQVAELRGATRERGLSLGDRACLALARQLALPVLTTDRAWLKLRLAVEIRLAR